MIGDSSVPAQCQRLTNTLDTYLPGAIVCDVTWTGIAHISIPVNALEAGLRDLARFDECIEARKVANDGD